MTNNTELTNFTSHLCSDHLFITILSTIHGRRSVFVQVDRQHIISCGRYYFIGARKSTLLPILKVLTLTDNVCLVMVIVVLVVFDLRLGFVFGSLRKFSYSPLHKQIIYDL